MSFFASFILMLYLLSRTAGVPAGADAIFAPDEKAQLQKTSSAEGRIKIYQKASVRIQKDLQQSVEKESFDTVPDTLKRWPSLLSTSFDDINANLKAEKKPKSLINYEIHVRKAIADTRGYKFKAPAEQQDVFDACLAQAEVIRRKIMDILNKL
jgi:hypothetical protein